MQTRGWRSVCFRGGFLSLCCSLKCGIRLFTNISTSVIGTVRLTCKWQNGEEGKREGHADRGGCVGVTCPNRTFPIIHQVGWLKLQNRKWGGPIWLFMSHSEALILRKKAGFVLFPLLLRSDALLYMAVRRTRSVNLRLSAWSAKTILLLHVCFVFPLHDKVRNYPAVLLSRVWTSWLMPKLPCCLPSFGPIQPLAYRDINNYKI